MNKLKLTLVLASLLSCGTVFAGNVLLVNTDADSASMVVSYKICEGDPTNPKCGAVETQVLGGKYSKEKGDTYKRVTVPADNKHLMIITAVTSDSISKKPIIASFKEKNAMCYGIEGDTIILDSQGTDVIICNNRGAAGQINTAG